MLLFCLKSEKKKEKTYLNFNTTFLNYFIIASKNFFRKFNVVDDSVLRCRNQRPVRRRRASEPSEVIHRLVRLADSLLGRFDVEIQRSSHSLVNLCCCCFLISVRDSKNALPCKIDLAESDVSRIFDHRSRADADIDVAVVAVLHAQLAHSGDVDGAVGEIREENGAADGGEEDAAVGAVADEAREFRDDEVGGVGFEIFTFVVVLIIIRCRVCCCCCC